MADASEPIRVRGYHAHVYVVPWLMLNREGLDILVHPLTNDSVEDHRRHALWLGTPVALKLGTLRPSYRAEQFPTA